MNITQCKIEHIEAVADLFDEYLVFYEKESNHAACRDFIKENITQERSVIFLLTDDRNIPVAFCQLYPAICSLSMRGYYYLSDLYVKLSERKNGYARFLMNHITEHFAANGAQRLTLDTANSNTIAQALYESLGYERENVYITYHKILPPQ